MVLLLNTLGNDDRSNQIVSQSNKLIISKYSLNATQLKIFLYAVSKIDSIDDKELKPINVKIDDFIADTEYKSNTSSVQLVKKHTRDLLSKVIEIKEDNGKILQTHFINDVIIDSDKRNMTLYLSKQLAPYLLELKNRFTTYNIENILSFNSALSIRYYQLLKRYYPAIKTFELDVVELKKILGVDKSYPKYFDFKKRCLIPQQTELKEHSDLYFSFREIKSGKSVVSLIFNIKAKEKKSVLDRETAKKEDAIQRIYENERLQDTLSNTEWFNTLRKWQIKRGVIMTLYKKYGEERLVYHIKRAKEDKTPKASLSGWFIKSLENDWYEDDLYNQKLMAEKKQKVDEIKRKKEEEKKLIETLHQTYTADRDKALRRYEFLYDDKEQIEAYLEDAKDNPFFSQIKSNLLNGNRKHFSFMIYKQWIIEHYLPHNYHTFEDYAESKGVYVYKHEGEYVITTAPIEINSPKLFDDGE